MKPSSALPPRSLALVPLLMAPVLVGALWLAVTRDAITPRVLIVVGAAAFAWYLLGGMVALSRLAWELRVRRDLRRAYPLLEAAERPAWLVDPQGRIMAQNELAALAQDLAGRSAAELVARYRALPQAVVESALVRMAGRSSARLDLNNGSTIAMTRRSGSLIQLWQLELANAPAPPRPKPLDTDFNTLPVALLRLSSDGVITDANDTARQLLADDAVGRPIATLLEGPGRPITDWLAETVESQGPSRPEVVSCLRASGERFVQVTLSPESGGGLIAMLLDVSEMKTLEAQVVQSQKMQAIGQLAGGIAHDFNNLLTAITGHCDLLMLRHDKSDPDYADLNQIEVNANRAAALVGQLLAFSRKQTLKPQVLDLRDTLSDLTHLLNRLVGERITLTFIHDPSLRNVRVDKRQFEQVIMNLVVNSRDAMDKGGEITIATRNVQLLQDEERDKARMPQGDYVLVSVADQGCGIAAEQLGQIFDPFFTTKRQGEGTGLGLSTVYGIVKQTGGYIFCDSTEGHGATFDIYFPASRSAAPAPEFATAPQSIDPTDTADTSASILLVEDEAPVRAFAARALRLRGYDVHEVDSGEAALRLLADSQVRFDLFITDVIMPGLDGPSWVREAVDRRPDTRIIFMSGYTDSAMVDIADSINNAIFLPKPFSLSDLVGCVENHLAGRAPCAPAVLH